MATGGIREDRLGGVLKMAPDCDPSSLTLSPQEGFLLSRVDGHTSWRLLREIGGLPADAVDSCLESWLSDGILVVPAAAGARKRTARPRAGARKPTAASKPAAAKPRPVDEPEIDESLLDPTLDIDIGTQRRVLAYDAGLGRDYYQLIGVPRDADARAIKRAYFTLSKEFHPDRFFRRNIGSYSDRLHRIFKRILEAYELLSDPETREQVDQSLKGTPPPPAPASTQHAASTQPAARPAPLSPIERLRQRMPFRLPESVRTERRQRAAEIFSSAQISAERGEFNDAASSARIAIAFEPWNPEYKGFFGEVHARAAEQRALRLLQSSDGAGEREALKLYEEALLYRPHDPQLNAKAAELALTLKDGERAREYAERAVEHSPNVAALHSLLAVIHQQLGEGRRAVEELERALELDPADERAVKLRRTLKPRRLGAPGGGPR